MRLLLLLLGGYVLYRLFRALTARGLPAPGRSEALETHKDPVCGVYVADADAVIGTMEGKRLYFCSRKCLEKFREQLAHNSK